MIVTFFTNPISNWEASKGEHNYKTKQLSVTVIITEKVDFYAITLTDLGLLQWMSFKIARRKSLFLRE